MLTNTNPQAPHWEIVADIGRFPFLSEMPFFGSHKDQEGADLVGDGEKGYHP